MQGNNIKPAKKVNNNAGVVTIGPAALRRFSGLQNHCFLASEQVIL
jgi:hypothetical protein